MDDINISVKNLSQEKHLELFKYTMDLGPFDNYELTNEFSEKLKVYLTKLPSSEKQYRNKSKDMVNTLLLLGYTQEQMLMLFCNDIGLLLAPAKRVFINVLIFGKIIDSNGKPYREEAIFKKPEDLRISPQRTYSRIRFLESEEGMRSRRKKGPVTRKNALVQSEADFKKQFNVDNGSLECRYPLNAYAVDKILKWPENKEFIKGLKQRGMKL